MQVFYELKTGELHCRTSYMTEQGLNCRPHLHYQIELAILTEGETRITIGGNEYTATAGDAFIVFPNQIHTFVPQKKESYFLFILSPDYVSELSAKITSNTPKSALIKGGATREIVELARQICEIYNGTEPYDDVITKGLMTVMLSKLLKKCELTDAQTGDYHVVGLIMNYCNENYHRPLTLGMLAKELHLNKYYISHIISSKLNIGFNEYINSLRVSNACKLLRSGSAPITEISEAVGFNTLRTFNRAFAKEMGMTPSEYRRLRGSKKENK